MSTHLSIKELEKKRDRLLKEQRSLIAKIKKHYHPAYDWFIARGIDFENVHKNLAAFSAAATLFISLWPQKHGSIDVTQADTATSHIIEAPKTKKTDGQRGQEVWATYGQLIRDSSAKYDIDPNLIFATIMIESGGNPKAIRQEPRLKDASYGLGQILYGTARGLGYRGTPEGLFDPATNIELIARYHRHNLNHYGHLTAQQLTTAYNTGSPYKKPWSGHLAKFNKWYNRIENVEIDLS